MEMNRELCKIVRYIEPCLRSGGITLMPNGTVETLVFLYTPAGAHDVMTAHEKELPSKVLCQRLYHVSVKKAR